MAKAIGFLAGVGTSLTAATLWFATSSAPVETDFEPIAPIDSASDRPAANGENRADPRATDNESGGPEQSIAAAEDVSAAPAGPISRGPESPASDKAAARRLLYQARRLALQGETGMARDLARRAGSFSVDWSASEQSPDDFLNDLKASRELPEPRRLPGTGKPIVLLDAAENQTADRSPEPAPDPAADVVRTHLVWPTAKEQAAKLLEEARADLNAGRRDDARAKAARAEEMNVVYTLFDDRPELILKEVDRPAAEESRHLGILIQPRRNLRKKRLELLDALDNRPSTDD